MDNGRRGSEGARRRPPTSTDVARLAGVSRSTVSLVLNEVPDSRIPDSTRQRVLEAVRALGYAPNAQARQLRAGASRLVLMPLSDLPLGAAMTEIEGLSDRLRSIGVTLLLHGDRKADGVSGALLWAELRPAVVLVGADRCSRESVDLLRRSGAEVLLIAQEPSPLGETVVFDQRWVGAEAAAHFLANGHRRLAALVPRGPLEPLGHARAAGLRAAAEAAGATAEEIPVEQTPDGASDVAVRLTRPGGPSAVFTFNDEFGALVHAALSDLGVRFPDDIALLGADDLPIARYLRPPLSSIGFGRGVTSDRLFLRLAALLGRSEAAGAAPGPVPPGQTPRRPPRPPAADPPAHLPDRPALRRTGGRYGAAGRRRGAARARR